MTKKNKRIISIVFAVIFGIVFAAAATIYVVCDWINTAYCISFNELLYTMALPLEGTANSVFETGVRSCAPKVIAAVLLYCGAAYLLLQKKVKVNVLGTFLKKDFKLNFLSLLRKVGALGCIIALLSSCIFVENSLDISGYMASLSERTYIYEMYYVDPHNVKITAPEKKKNIIYLYVESLETTYASKAVGGAQETNNYIPKLTQLAQEYTSFSNSDKLGGFHTMHGATWTMGAILATTVGIPYAFPVDQYSADLDSNFAAGITSLGDILDAEGYNQEFLCGSESGFAGKKDYLTRHGNYEVFDYFTAVEKGYVPEGRYVWWGYEDSILFKIAKDEARRLAAENEPFNLTILTVDTHHLGGYYCSECGTQYETGIENVIACTDNQVYNFVKWCETQSFFEDTVIVITGDHPRMDTLLVDGISMYDRTIYNCFINSFAKPSNTKNREFTTVDMFPTVLAAMGFTIEGNRLGIGTNVFSATPTLAERKGCDWIEAELAKNSDFYVKKSS